MFTDSKAVSTNGEKLIQFTVRVQGVNEDIFKVIEASPRATAASILKVAVSSDDGGARFLRLDGQVYAGDMPVPITANCSCEAVAGARENFRADELVEMYEFNMDNIGLSFTTSEWLWSWLGYTPESSLRLSKAK
jgi:hypothetical protein